MSLIDVEEERGNTHAVLVLTGREGVRERRNTNGDHLQLVLHSLHLLKEVIIIVHEGGDGGIE